MSQISKSSLPIVLLISLSTVLGKPNRNQYKMVPGYEDPEVQNLIDLSAIYNIPMLVDLSEAQDLGFEAEYPRGLKSSEFIRLRRVPGSEFLGKRSAPPSPPTNSYLERIRENRLAKEQWRMQKRVPGSEFLG
ncbi:uncharacterized protein LOC111696838 [Eurytemora carolleeae]|uniref:uncharacterized protein LOC111696838 n=1 Tax=Eurytemora carolleeae TaxID=1294199 RepID=UPI000C75DB47|nr:uncharacterized protein LOC111696838 [Eurytemora carolleeae]|eukprot:XP_023322354.1 uncharacterized protein LOC111696838 [Eurytemora affinis]